MFFKQSGFKPRSNSTSSQGSGSGSGGVAGSPPKEEAKLANKNLNELTGPAVSAGAAGRRRSSASGDKFAGLQSTKRGSHDERKAGWAEQKPGQTGILGGMWNTFTKGN